MDKPTRKFVPKSARLMDQVREVLRFHHYAYNTEKSYVSWILKFIRFHNKKHPNDTDYRRSEIVSSVQGYCTRPCSLHMKHSLRTLPFCGNSVFVL